MIRKLFLSLALSMGMHTAFADASEQSFSLGKELERLAFTETVQFAWENSEATDESVYLVFDARIDAGDFTSGGAPALEVQVNRVPVRIDHLRNKPIQWIHGTRRFISWGQGENTFMVLYHTWEDEAPQYGRLHRYVFDVSSLLRTEGENQIQFKSVFSGIPDSVVELRNIQIQVGGEVKRHPYPVTKEPLYLSAPLLPFRQKAISRHRGTDLELDISPDFQNDKVVLDVSAPLVAEAIKAGISDEGEVDLEMNGFTISSHLNVGLPGAGWQRLDKKLSWKTERSEGEGVQTIVYEGEKIRIKREVISFAYGVSIRDQVTNLTPEDLPVGMLYENDLGDIKSLQEFRLFGSRQGTLYANTVPARLSATTPSVFFKNTNGGFGILIEDDILRNQSSYLAWDETFAFGTDMFYLKPGASHEFLWSVIPTGEGDYYDYLNKVRAKWNTYQEIPGLFGFVYPHGKDRSLTTPEKIAAFFEETGITNPCIPPATNMGTDAADRNKMIYGNEPAEVIEDALSRVATFTEMAKAGGIDFPFLLYTDVHLVRTDVADEVLKELEDSVVLDYRGSPVEYRPGWLYNLLPTEETSAGARFKSNLEKYFATPGITGVFLDEWDHSRARYSFNHPDDNTALLEENFRIRRKIGIVPLLIRSYQVGVNEWLVQKDSVTYANQFDSTQSSTALPIVHFAEPTQYDSYLLRGAQLSRTPLSLSVKRSPDPWMDAYEFLKQGVLSCFYARRLTGDHMLRHVYPITAKSLGPGYVVGEDKIVTIASGEYSFGDERAMTAKIFGGKDGLYLRSVEAAGEKGEITRLNLQLDAENQEAAVIVGVR